MFRGKRITALFAAVLVCMVMPAFAGNGMTYAADTIAKVTVNGEGTKSYSSFEKMVSDLSDYEDKSVTIEMQKDWPTILGFLLHMTDGDGQRLEEDIRESQQAESRKEILCSGTYVQKD